MANPKISDGYTSIANEILEALSSANLNGTELAVVIFILRKTYGFHKKTDRISITQFEKNVKSSRPAICKALTKLVVNKVLLVNKTLLINEYGLNKDYSQWVVNKPLLVNKTRQGSKQNETQLVNKPLHTKDTLTKETIQKKKEYISELEKVIVSWNSLVKKVDKWTICRKLTDNLERAYIKLRKKYKTKEEFSSDWSIAMKGYLKYIKENSWYDNRFSLYDFLSNGKGFIQYLNK